MWLLAIYSLLMVAGDFLDYFIGLFIERVWPAASLPSFLGMYFLTLWLAWVIAVRLTKPRAAAPK